MIQKLVIGGVSMIKNFMMIERSTHKMVCRKVMLSKNDDVKKWLNDFQVAGVDEQC